MTFSSIYFLFIFFPIVFILHLIVPSKCKNIVLLVASIYFYAWGEPSYVGLILFSSVFNYVMGLDIDHRRNRGRKRSFIFAICVNIFLLFFFKYVGFCIETLNAILPFDLQAGTLPLPIGISFYTFQAMSYIADVYTGKIRAQKKWKDFAMYLMLFPQLIAGPIVKYTDIQNQITDRKLSFSRIAQGAELLVTGLAKKVLLANNLGLLYTTIQAATDRSVCTAWLGIAAYTMQIYFDFSGYSDMAIGMGHMLGFSFPENFRYPYLSESVSEFWRRWHMTLSFWFREYVYIPLGGNRKGTLRQIRNICVVWLLTGLWHGASWNFVLWGAYYGILLLLEKFVLAPLLTRLPGIVRHLYTLLAIAVGWVLFSNTDLTQAVIYLKNMFGIGTSGLLDAFGAYQLRSNILLLIIAMLCCTPTLKRWFSHIKQRRPYVCSTVIAGIFLLCTAYLIAGSYNPFLYFRF